MPRMAGIMQCHAPALEQGNTFTNQDMPWDHSTDADTASGQAFGTATLPIRIVRRLHHHPGPLLQQLAVSLARHAPELEAKQLALVAWGLAKLSDRDAPDASAGQLLDAIAAASIEKADQFTSQVRPPACALCHWHSIWWNFESCWTPLRPPAWNRQTIPRRRYLRNRLT